jgi:hypothetical protein
VRPIAGLRGLHAQSALPPYSLGVVKPEKSQLSAKSGRYQGGSHHPEAGIP